MTITHHNHDAPRSNSFPDTWWLRPLLLGLVLLASGCERKGIEEQEVDKGIEQVPERVPERTDTPAPESARASEESAAEASQQIGPWVVPEGWTLDPEPRQMRLATYIAPDPSNPIEIAVTRFPGRVGGELANINRWRGQMGLAPVDQPGLESVIDRYESPGYEGYQTRIDSSAGVMLAAGVYDASADQTWFVRATIADQDAADRVQDDLFNMARSIAGLGEKGDG